MQSKEYRNELSYYEENVLKKKYSDLWISHLIINYSNWFLKIMLFHLTLLFIATTLANFFTFKYNYFYISIY